MKLEIEISKIAIIGYLLIGLAFGQNAKDFYNGDNVSFFEVPLVCGAANEIGCGSRAKPFFNKLETYDEVKEVWLNRSGTLFAVVYDQNIEENRKLEIVEINLTTYNINGNLVKKKELINEHLKNFKSEGKWYKGDDVDLLSKEEAGIIAQNVTDIGINSGIISQEEALKIKPEIEAYFKRELVKTRSYKELVSSDLRNVWVNELKEILSVHITEQKTMDLWKAYSEIENKKRSCKKSCCKKGR